SVPANGTVSLSTGGSFTYTPNGDFFGADAFEYAADDGRASATATVSIEVVPVNDPPRIEIDAAPANVRGREMATIEFSMSDVDDDITSSSVVQVSGIPLSGLIVRPTTASFFAPDFFRVEDVVLEIAATDATGESASERVRVTVYPLSHSGKMTTIVGDKSGGGVDWVIIADGYREDELEKFRADAAAVADYVLNQEPVGVYRPAWNVHLIETISNESGIDIPHEGVVRDTALDSYFCTDRTVCANGQKVFQAVAAEQPAYDIVLVLVNSDRYGGGGGVFAAATTHASSNDIVLHELGHSFAGLADEYPDPVTAQIALPSYREDLYPNVTTLTDPADIKWRHWFADPLNVPRNPGERGIGIFEGSFYREIGYYRPADQLFMRLTA